VLGYAHASIIDPACAAIPVASADVGDDGQVHHSPARTRIVTALETLAAAAGAG
jgi:hypothetical protein